MILAEKDSTVWSHCFFRFSFFLRDIAHTHTHTNIHATVSIRICANFHANTHTMFPSLTPNNCVVTRQIYSITATNPLTPPFFLFHLSILFILPLTSEYLYTQEDFWGFSVVLAVNFFKCLFVPFVLRVLCFWMWNSGDQMYGNPINGHPINIGSPN